jgi:hypothetical protein
MCHISCAVFMLSIEMWIFSVAYGNNFSSSQNISCLHKTVLVQTPFRRTAPPLRPLGVETDILRLNQSCTLSLLSLSRFKCMEFEFVSNFFFTVQSTRLPAGRARNRDSFSAGVRDFSPLLSIQTSSEAHPASYPVTTGSSFRMGKTVGTWNPPLFTTDVKNTEPPHPHTFPRVSA